MDYRATKGVVLAVLLTTGSVVSLLAGQAWADDATSRIDQLEARVLKLEAASNKQAGMMEHMMKHKAPMSDHDMGGPMGTMPQPAAPMAPAGGAAGGRNGWRHVATNSRSFSYSGVGSLSDTKRLLPVVSLRLFPA